MQVCMTHARGFNSYRTPSLKPATHCAFVSRNEHLSIITINNSVIKR